VRDLLGGSGCFGPGRDLVLRFSGGFGVLSPGGGDASDGVGMICIKGGFISGRFWV
jgi:hypothetical protein